MKRVFSFITFLLSINSIQIIKATSTIQVPASTLSLLDGVSSFILNANPIILVILGIVVIIAGKFAKYIGALMIILGLIFLLLQYF